MNPTQLLGLGGSGGMMAASSATSSATGGIRGSAFFVPNTSGRSFLPTWAIIALIALAAVFILKK